MARNDPELRVRLPKEMKSFVEEEASLNGSSKNSEIVRAIRAQMNAKDILATATASSRGKATSEGHRE